MMFKKTPESIIGFLVVVLFVLTGIIVTLFDILGIRVTPYNPIQQDVGVALSGPSWDHLFGCDFLGRDVFSRVIASVPNDVAVSFSVVFVAIIVGALLGSLAGFKGGMLDELLMRFTDVIFSLPVLVIAMVIAVALGPGLTHMMIAMIVIWWPPYARMARGESLRVAHQNFIEAARFAGQRTIGILFKHVLPNISITMLVYATLDVGTVILVYAGLSYLGLSVRPPLPDLGEMISNSQDYLITAPWLPIIPGIVIAVIVIGFSVLGDGIRDALEAR
jgi:peptide/nickel transport system permease protein